MSASGQLVVTSIVRHANLKQASCFVSVLELNAGRILMKSPVPGSTRRARQLKKHMTQHDPLQAAQHD